LKKSLGSQQAQAVLSCSQSFKTKKISFKYAFSEKAAIAFSIKRTMGSAVLRNRFKRLSRSALEGPLFKNTPIHLLVRPTSKITKNISVLEDFDLLKKHINNKEGFSQ
tara:strand:- start:117 stop:440 length:324 start_codon:yes stop_codon:yes gene_type:complete